ncbi:Metallo-dependent phosphatase-like protein [Lophiotrema nucula]|uniref:Metallo-dependent phosphatase-like protein n=1 Tax=Lophiotrema nucula TaxID=690887 RepID=A0A6A5YIS0_9PLEO|nr:Metallo-dependent phosphatase-like protein [Lophiotrema nucula]
MPPRYYHDTGDRHLIDLIPSSPTDLYVSDEDETFYAKEDGAYITTNRVPRRIQRHIPIYLFLLLTLWVSWRTILGPRYAAHRQLIKEMDTVPQSQYGANMRPEFKDMIMVQKLDTKLLPQEHHRLVFVGDVHGCIDELKALLEQVDFREGKDHLVLLGDIISKGPDSPGVVSFAKKIGASCVRGNHEDKVLLSIAEMEARHEPLPGPNEDPSRSVDNLDEESFSQGDYKTRKLAKQFSKGEIEWLRTLPVILHIGQVNGVGDMVAVHAGLVPGVPLDRQDPFQVMNMRTINLKTRMPSETRDHTPWEQFWNHQQKKQKKSDRTTVVYGHDRKRGLSIEKYSKGLDSGCVSGGRLTAMVIDKDGKEKFVHVKCKGYVD